MKRLICFFS